MTTGENLLRRLSNIADHNCGPEFDRMFCADQLNELDRETLLNLAEGHFKHMLRERGFFYFKLKRKDKRDLKSIRKLTPTKPLLPQIAFLGV